MSHRLLLLPSLFLLFLFVKFDGGTAVEYGTHSIGCPLYNSCSGSNVTIAYPFWVVDEGTNFSRCGYPGFGVYCPTVPGDPIFRLPGDTYAVRSINYLNQSLTLVDIDIANQTCPRARNNITLENLPLTYSMFDLNITFHFNCTSYGPLVIPCFQSGENQTYITVGAESDDSLWFDHCAEKVVTTVIGSEVNQYLDRRDLGMVVGDAFAKGFLLDWRPDAACGNCEASGGRCGYSNNPDGRAMVGDFLCFCSEGFSVNDRCKGSRSFSFWLKILLAGGALMAGSGIVVIIYCCYGKSSFIESLMPKKDTIEAFIAQYRLSAPKRYNYSEIKRMTNTFKDELGRGGFGSVFKGTLVDGSPVAIKVLKESKTGGEEFINEVASIGRTSHVNIVALKGFCYEGRKRALVYELMPNGSLEKFIYHNIPKDSEQHLGVEKLYEIALGIARGLEYLHRGCNTRILHFDIKPHNILLDKDFCPKISDFGLAKLHTRKESVISMVEARGTIGYIAPEVFNQNFGGVSHKSDVYSYGMMVVEMVGGRKNLDVRVVHSSEIYFPPWIYKRLELGEDLQLQQGSMTEVENEIARKMIIVGLWCIQANPSQRPSMNKVIEMLEGSMEVLQIPPNPFFSSPSRSPETSSTTLETISLQ